MPVVYSKDKFYQIPKNACINIGRLIDEEKKGKDIADIFNRHELTSDVYRCIRECTFENINRYYDSVLALYLTLEAPNTFIAVMHKYFLKVPTQFNKAIYEMCGKDCMNNMILKVGAKRCIELLSWYTKEKDRIGQLTASIPPQPKNKPKQEIKEEWSFLYLLDINILFYLAKIFNPILDNKDKDNNVIERYIVSRSLRDPFYGNAVRVLRGDRIDPFNSVIRSQPGILNTYIEENNWNRELTSGPFSGLWKHWARDECIMTPDSNFSFQTDFSGIPLACGLSGSAGMLFWDVFYFHPNFNEEELRIFILATFAGLCLDGGHSLQEVLASFYIISTFLLAMIEFNIEFGSKKTKFKEHFKDSEKLLTVALQITKDLVFTQYNEFTIKIYEDLKKFTPEETIKMLVAILNGNEKRPDVIETYSNVLNEFQLETRKIKPTGAKSIRDNYYNFLSPLKNVKDISLSIKTASESTRNYIGYFCP